MTSFIIVESPAKAKKISQILGIPVKASLGHIRDLPIHELGIDIENQFQPTYEIIHGKQKIVSELQTAIRSATTIYLASDDDREGESISWHLAEQFHLPLTTPRMIFHEITPTAIRTAFQNPRTIHMPSVNSQQTRRILDRMVGYKVSPLLCRAFGQSKLSAGRVQSAALRILDEREQQHEQFQTKFHLALKGTFNDKISVQWKPNESFPSFYSPESITILNKWTHNNKWNIQEPIFSEETETPPPPFTTSTLAQEASKQLHFSAKYTAKLAQTLYESGWITYHRTDSVQISQDAKQSIHEWIQTTYGTEWVVSRNYKQKQKNAQEAHECVRPVQVDRIPTSSTEDKDKLYALIWCRTISTQVIPCIWKRIRITWVHIEDNYGFWEWMERIVFQLGFLQIWKTYFDSKSYSTEFDMQWKTINNWVLTKLSMEEKPQEPPGRYRESSFIKTLEQRGIGRPSTYATIVETLKERNYIDPKSNPKGTPILIKWHTFLPKLEEGTTTVQIGSENNVWMVTPIGRQVCQYLNTNFNELIQDKFTATMEYWLDEIANEKTNWKDVLAVFWSTLHTLLQKAQTIVIPKIDILLNERVTIKTGRFGPYVVWNDQKIKLPQTRDLKEWTMELLEQEHILPSILGTHEGYPVYWKQGNYGPYLQFGETKISYPSETIPTWEEIQPHLSIKKQCRNLNDTICVRTTKYGWAIQSKNKFFKPPPNTTLETITLEQAKLAIQTKFKTKRK